jgi:hypothetical protein
MRNFWWKTGSRLSFWRWEKIQFRNRTKIIIWRKQFCLRSFLIGWQAKARVRSAGVAAFLTANDNQRGRTGSKRYEGREDLRGRVLFQIDRGPGILIYRVFKLRNGCRKKWWSKFGQLRDLLEHVHGFMNLHHLKSRIKKIIFMMMIIMMIRVKTMIGTWMTWRSRLAFLSC